MKIQRSIKVLAVTTVVFCVLLVTNLLPLLRGDVPGLTGDQKWEWPYELPRWLYVIPSLLGVAIYLVGGLSLLKRENGSRFPLRLILWAFVGAVLLPLLLMTMEARPLFLLFSRTASILTGGNEMAASMITDPAWALRHWPEFVAQYRVPYPFGGIALAPPGLAMVHYTIERGFAAVPSVAAGAAALLRPQHCLSLTAQTFGMMGWTDSQYANAWIAMAMPLWAALAVAPLYRLGTLVFDRQVARWGVLLWPLVPGLGMFLPRFNVFYALIAVVALLLLWRGLERSRLRWIGLSGFVITMGLFFNFATAPLPLLGGLTVLLYGALRQRNTPQQAVWNLVAYAIGGLSFWLIYAALAGVTPLTFIQQSMRYHLILDRPYLPWLVIHPYDMFLFVGLPVAGLAIWRITRARSASNADIFAWAGTITLLIFVFSGTGRGETGRVWLFLAPVWMLLAADMLRRFTEREQRTVLAVQALCLFCMFAVLRVNFTTFDVPMVPPDAASAPQFPLNVQLERGSDAITFVGLSLEKGQEAVTLHLQWRADGTIHHPYALTLVPVPPDKSRQPSQTWTPMNEKFPPSCWQPGRTFVDTVKVPLGPNPQAGDWLFSLSVRDYMANENMQIKGQNTDQIGIGPVSIP